MDDARKKAQANAGRMYEEEYEVIVVENQYVDKTGKPIPDNLVSVVKAVKAGVDPATLVKREMSEQLKDKKKRKELEERLLKNAKDPFYTDTRSDIEDFVKNLQARDVKDADEADAEDKEPRDSNAKGKDAKDNEAKDKDSKEKNKGKR